MKPINKPFAAESDAITFLKSDGYKWNATAEQWQRGTVHIDQARVTVGKCKSGQWLVMSAPIHAVQS